MEAFSETKRKAMIYLNNDLESFIRSIPEPEREDFFHSMNADLWKAEFGRFLSTRQREFASND